MSGSEVCPSLRKGYRGPGSSDIRTNNSQNGSVERYTPSIRATPPPSRRATSTIGDFKGRRTSTPSIYARPPSASRRLSPSSSGQQRPMTARRSSGYKSPTVQASTESTTEDNELSSSREREARIHERVSRIEVLLDSIAAKLNNSSDSEALEEAREARRLAEHLLDQEDGEEIPYIDLFGSVQLSLALALEQKGLQSEAIEIYTPLVNDKRIADSNRFRINLGNLHFARAEYSTAIKMYRMAFDKLPEMYRSLKHGILKNVAVALVKMGKLKSAVEQYQRIAEQGIIDTQLLRNMLWCYNKLGDLDAMQSAFARCVTNMATGDSGLDASVAESRRDLVDCGALLAAKMKAEGTEDGYDWCIELLKEYGFVAASCELSIHKADALASSKQFQEAVCIYKEVREKSPELGKVVTDRLASLQALGHGGIDVDKQGKAGVILDRLDPETWIHKGNIHSSKGEISLAKESYEAALQIDPENIEALYNQGLAAKTLAETEEDGQIVESLRRLAEVSFRRIHSKVPNFVEVLYQLGSLCEQESRLEDAIEWFELVHSLVPEDPCIISTLGSLHSALGDEAKAVSLYQESYALDTSDVDVLCWLAVYYVDNEMYEKAMEYFILASRLEPEEVKWSLMVASCYRRTGQTLDAFNHYLRIHQKHSDCVESLKFLVQLSDAVGKSEIKSDFEEKLERLTKIHSVAMRDHPGILEDSSPSLTHRPSEGFESMGASHHDLLPL